MIAKCLAQEHTMMSPARARTRTTCSGVERTNYEATPPSTLAMTGQPIEEDIYRTVSYINSVARVHYKPLWF